MRILLCLVTGTVTCSDGRGPTGIIGNDSASRAAGPRAVPSSLQLQSRSHRHQRGASGNRHDVTLTRIGPARCHTVPVGGPSAATPLAPRFTAHPVGQQAAERGRVGALDLEDLGAVEAPATSVTARRRRPNAAATAASAASVAWPSTARGLTRTTRAPPRSPPTPGRAEPGPYPDGNPRTSPPLARFRDTLITVLSDGHR